MIKSLLKFIIRKLIKYLSILHKYLGIDYVYSWIHKYGNRYKFLCICWILNTLCIILGINIFEYKMPFSVYLFHDIGLLVIIIFQLNKLYIHLSKDEKKKKIVKKKEY